ncbi:MAG: helix-turn-helix domain-containing protein [Myxococcales bacterium]|nr:helix-turn-helix domain-containing protein [Myxococcales bacterium]
MVGRRVDATALHFLLLTVAGWMGRRQSAAIEYLLEENRVLREHLGDRRLRFTDAQRRRLASKGWRLGRKRLRALASIVTPETILRWYRKLIATKYDGSEKRGPGRPPVADEIRDLVLRIARENPRWGYRRIVGAIRNLGREVSASTVKRLLETEGLPPAPERGKHTTWSTFLRRHWDAITAADFFTVEVLTAVGLVRYHVLFVMELATRRVHLAGVALDPGGAWMLQIGRNLTDAFDGFLLDKRYLIVDRDPLFTRAFRRLLADEGVDVLRLPARSPDLNAHAERFVRSIREECLDHVVPLGERHLRRILTEYLEHYHHERNHQGIGNTLIEPRAGPANDNAEVLRKQRLGGLLGFYERRAA